MVGAVIYVRVSTKEQTENLSLPTQLRACEEYCRRQGLNIKLFGYWKRKLCRKPAAGLTFVPVAIKPSQSTVVKPTATLRLIIRGGSSIEIGDGFNQDTLRRVLDTVGWTP